MKKLLFFVSSFIALQVNAQLQVADTMSTQDLIQSLAGPGLSISNITVNCPGGAIGQFFGDNTNIGLSSGVLLTTGSIQNAIGPNTTGSQSENLGAPGDADLSAIISDVTNDACVIEFDLYTIGDSLSFNYIFGSEEYMEFVNTNFNDVFAFFISGPGIAGVQNIALIPGTNTPVTIDNVNAGNNNTYYVDNGDGFTPPFSTGNQYIQYDGYTTVLRAEASDLIPCSTYHLKLAVADVFDDGYDSGVFLEGGSFVSNAVLIASSSAVDPNFSFAVEGCVDAYFQFTIEEALPNDFVVNFTLSGTATEGLDYANLPSSITIPAGSTTAFLDVTVLSDALAEGVEYLTLNIISPCGTEPYDSASLEIFDYSAYNLLVQVDDFTGCVGSDATLTAVTPGFINYTWSPATYLNTTSGTQVVASNIAADITYTVNATLGTCNYTQNVALDVNPLFASSLPAADTACSTGSVELSAVHSPSNINIVSYQWEPALLVSSPNTQTTQAFPLGTSEFYVTMISDQGCTVRDTINVVLLDGGPSVVISPSDTLICLGQTVNFTANVYEQCLLILNEFDSFGDGWNGGSVEFVQNGNSIGVLSLEDFVASGSDSILVLQGLPLSLNVNGGNFPDEMSFSLVYSDGTVIFADGPLPTTGNNVFTFTPSCGVPSPTYTYNWAQGNGLSATNVANVSATPSSTSTYILTADNGLCNGAGFALITVDKPSFEALGDTICLGEAAQLSAAVEDTFINTCEYNLILDSDFGWFGSSLDVLVNGNNVGNFAALSGNAENFDFVVNNLSEVSLVYNAPFFDNGETVALLDAENNPVFNSALPINGVIFTGIVTCPLSLEPSLACSYTLDMIDLFGDGWNGGFVTVNVDGNNVGAFSALGTGSQASFEVPVGATYTLTYTSGAFEEENTYSLLDPNGAQLFADGINPQTGLVFTGVGTSSGCTVIPPDFSYAWTPSSFLNFDTILTPVASGVLADTEFYFTYTNAYTSCTFTDTALVVISSVGSGVDLSNLPNVLCCTDDTITFNPFDLPEISLGDSVLWNGVYTTGPVSVTDSGSYTIEVINSFGCNGFGSMEVDLSCLNPVIDAPDTVDINQNVQVAVVTSPSLQDEDSYLWELGTLFDNSSLQNPTFNSGTYGNNDISATVGTTYTFGDGSNKTCTETATATIFVNAYASVQFPNAFTPNGDGLNDTFGPIISGNAGIRTFLVYNRWGDVVYRYSDTNTTWDGIWDGANQPADTYTYFISLNMPDGSVQTYSGTLSLFY
jgi:gliding motility-associated-like protein